ncbi:putative enterotoxin [Ophiocordyceps australis]|uniref:Putative enterotoxin n=1 Tax=Ophiocordyceps australis TaxID=1399860 RepID=A0A2C5YDT2_9HYPO|nr:putative enterotoxin [Ophiocordyceps australis]
MPMEQVPPEKVQKIVYRGDTRPPNVIAGYVENGKPRPGFYPKPGPEVPAKYNLLSHVQGNIDNTAYVSTTSDIQRAKLYASPQGQRGYIYKIEASTTFVDVNRSLRIPKYWGNLEFAAMKGIPYSQVIGYTQVTDDVTRLLELNKAQDIKFTENKQYKPLPKPLKGSTTRSELAVFPKGHKALELQPWKDFKNTNNGADVVFKKIVASEHPAVVLAGKTRTPVDVASNPKTKSLKPQNGDSAKSSKTPQQKGKGLSPSSTRSKFSGWKFQTAKTVTSAVAFAAVAPFARRLLEILKEWHHPIGKAVKWLDDAIASVQEAIGGPQRHDIEGNDLKASFICALRGGNTDSFVAGRKNKICTSSADEFTEEIEQEIRQGQFAKSAELCQGIETYAGGHPAVWQYEKRRCAAIFRHKAYPQWLLTTGLEQLMQTCAQLETNPPQDKQLLARLENRCESLLQETEKVKNGQVEKIEPTNPGDGSCKYSSFKKCYWLGEAPNCSHRTSRNLWGMIRHPTDPNKILQIMSWTRDTTQSALCKSSGRKNPGASCCAEYGAGCWSARGFKSLACERQLLKRGLDSLIDEVDSSEITEEQLELANNHTIDDVGALNSTINGLFNVSSAE